MLYCEKSSLRGVAPRPLYRLFYANKTCINTPCKCAVFVRLYVIQASLSYDFAACSCPLRLSRHITRARRAMQSRLAWLLPSPPLTSSLCAFFVKMSICFRTKNIYFLLAYMFPYCETFLSTFFHKPPSKNLRHGVHPGRIHRPPQFCE